jgi:hypothetical protein
MSARRLVSRIATLGALVGLALSLGCGQNVSPSAAPYNQDSARSGADRFGRQTQPGERGKGTNGSLGGSSLVLGMRVTMDDIYGSGNIFESSPTKFLEWLGKKGFGALGIYAVDPTPDPDQKAKFWFDDVPLPDGTKLSEHGYEAGGKNIAELVAAAKQVGIGVQVDLTRLALSYRSTTLAPRPYAGDSLDGRQIGAICSYLCDQTGVDSITGRGFPPEWLAEAARACQNSGRVFFAGDYATVRASELAAAAPLDRGPETLAMSELAMARARSGAHMLWAGVTAERKFGADSPFGADWGSLRAAQDALAYRTIASTPQGLFLDMPPAVVDRLEGGVLEKLKSYAATRATRPVCAVLVLGDSTPRNLDAMVNGISSAGYELVLGGGPGASLKSADAVYIVATKKADGSMPELPKELTDGMLNAGKVCIVQLCGPLPSLGTSASWDAVRRSFGIGDSDIPTITSGPKTGRYAGQEFPCAAAGGSPWGVLLTKEALSQAEALLEGDAEVKPASSKPEGTDATAGTDAGKTQSVIVVSRYSYGSTGQNVLVNGAELAPEMAFPISQALARGKGLQGPTRVWCSVGSPVALYSPEGSGHVKLVYDDGGEAKTLERDLKQGELYIADVAKQTTVGQLPTGDKPRQ